MLLYGLWAPLLREGDLQEKARLREDSGPVWSPVTEGHKGKSDACPQPMGSGFLHSGGDSGGPWHQTDLQGTHASSALMEESHPTFECNDDSGPWREAGDHFCDVIPRQVRHEEELPEYYDD
jgi:hypothetical protein